MELYGDLVVAMVWIRTEESAEIVAQSIFEDFLENPTLSRMKLKDTFKSPQTPG